MTEREYRRYDALSYSFLKAMRFHPRVILDGMEDKSSSGLTLGSLVDNIMTGDDYDWTDDFVVSTQGLNLNGDDATSNLLKHIYNTPDFPIEDESMLRLSEELGLWGNIKDRQKRLNRIFSEKFNDQVQLLQSVREGKSIISEADLAIALTMVDTLKLHRFTRDYFLTPIGGEIKYQVAVIFEINGEKCKSLLDQVNIDHEKKIIYPIDLKTGAERNFLGNFNRYEYYLQGAMYSLAIDAWKIQNGYDDYEVRPFQFIYISRANPSVPAIYEMESNFILDHINGFENIYGEHEKGVIDLVEDYRWYIQSDIYDVTRDVHENNGKIVLRNNKKQ